MRAGEYAFFDAPFLAFAHRGGAFYGPNLGRENTRHAFAQAVALGYRYLETDVHATSDGVLVAFHDHRLDRATDQVGLVVDTPYGVVQQALIKGKDRIPTLAELLVAFPEARFNIDAKSPAAVALLAETIADHDAYDRVCLGSFGFWRIHDLRRRLGPRVATAASPVGVAANRFFPWLTAVLNTSAPALQMPLNRRIFGADFWVLTDRLVKAAHAAGKHVHIWTIDDATSMERLIDMGVDGIFTDRVDTLKDVLVRRELWTGAS